MQNGKQRHFVKRMYNFSCAYSDFCYHNDTGSRLSCLTNIVPTKKKQQSSANLRCLHEKLAARNSTLLLRHQRNEFTSTKVQKRGIFIL